MGVLEKERPAGSGLKDRVCGACVHCASVHGLAEAVFICRNRPGCTGLWVAVRAGDGCGRFKRAAERVRVPEGARMVPLSRGKFALVDARDYARVMRYSWYAAPSGSGLLPIHRDLQGCLTATGSPLRGTPPLQGESFARGDGAGDRRTWYAVRKETGRTIRMHREIMRAGTGLVVDHINHDGLDNRRCNLRVCTHRENIRNQRGQRGRSSRFKGVSRDRRLGKWRAQIWHDGVHRYLGLFASEIEAARAYNAAARELFGAYAFLNRI